MPIREFLNGYKFDPETTRVMGVAYEIVWAALELEAHNTVAREAVARRIIALAEQGERDPEHLCDRVLADLRARPTV